VYGSYDTVVTCFPNTAPWIDIGFVFKLVESVMWCDVFLPGEIREKEWVCFHQILQRVLVIMMPAGIINVESHGNIVWLFKANGSEDIFSLSHG